MAIPIYNILPYFGIRVTLSSPTTCIAPRLPPAAVAWVGLCQVSQYKDPPPIAKNYFFKFLRIPQPAHTLAVNGVWQFNIIGPCIWCYSRTIHLKTLLMWSSPAVDADIYPQFDGLRSHQVGNCLGKLCQCLKINHSHCRISRRFNHVWNRLTTCLTCSCMAGHPGSCLSHVLCGVLWGGETTSPLFLINLFGWYATNAFPWTQGGLPVRFFPSSSPH